MLSATQIELVKGFVNTVNADGFPYYFVYQPYYSQNSSNYADIIFCYSKEPFTVTTTSSGYSVKNSSSETYKLDIFSANYSSYNSNNFRSVRSLFSSLTVQKYEWSYTNCSFASSSAVLPDLGVINYAQTSYAGVQSLLLCVLVLLSAFRLMFKR